MRRLATATLLVSAATLSVGAQADDPVGALVARAGVYVAQYEKDFSGLVGELHETQRIIRPDASIKRERTLVCDVLLVPVDTGVSARLPATVRAFRDVLSVDGKPVRDRDERLRKLFVTPSKDAREQFLRIAREGARHDIGMRHLFDSLMLPLQLLRADIAPRFRFEAIPEGLAFTETRSPALFRSRGLFSDRVKDMFLTGTFGLAGDGTVKTASLHATSEDIELGVSIRYETHPDLKLAVPAEAKETMRQPKRQKADHTEVTAVYTNFRRFQVATSETVSEPK
jgi:hypothetical protein